jgi:hypothetical protein
MAFSPRLSPDLIELAEKMETFEATPSVANTGTGARREGEKFEELVGEMWKQVAKLFEDSGATVSEVKGPGTRWYSRLTVGDRDLIIPFERRRGTSGEPGHRWLETDFNVTDLIASYPGRDQAIAQYAPSSGIFAGENYTNMFDGLKTQFDDTAVLVQAGVLHEKILFEYKTAKSNLGRQVDGNAHERLSFQMMQYLEAATRYTRCSLIVLANGAFVRYRNKYHVNFHIQADRLENFAWFSMHHACMKSEYLEVITGLAQWLFEGKTRLVKDH